MTPKVKTTSLDSPFEGTGEGDAAIDYHRVLMRTVPWDELPVGVVISSSYQNGRISLRMPGYWNL